MTAPRKLHLVGKLGKPAQQPADAWAAVAGGLSTKSGRKLATKLAPYLRYEGNVFRDVLCTRITKAAATLQRLAVKKCNEPTTAADEATQWRLKGKLAELVALLGPDIKGAALTLEVDGDPRGHVVKIGVPCETPHGGDTWGRGGLFCVGD